MIIPHIYFQALHSADHSFEYMTFVGRSFAMSILAQSRGNQIGSGTHEMKPCISHHGLRACRKLKIF